MKAEEYILAIEKGEVENLSLYSLELIAKRFRELEKINGIIQFKNIGFKEIQDISNNPNFEIVIDDKKFELYKQCKICFHFEKLTINQNVSK